MVRSKLRNVNSLVGTSKFDHNVYLTCNHINSDKMLVGPRGSFHVRQSFTCESKGLVYAVECKHCGELYIRVTCRKLKDRFRDHRQDVLNKKANKEVSSHFQ